MSETARGRSWGRRVHQGAGKIVGSTIGETPNATDTMANPIKAVEAHTPKAISDEIRRSRIAMGGYKTVGENKVMSVSKSVPNRDYVAGEGSEVRMHRPFGISPVLGCAS
jgi:hypothetical protein